MGMSYQRCSGVFGLIGALADEAKWFTDQRAPYPIERSIREAISSPLNGGSAPQALVDGARGVARAVLDDEVDSTEPRRRSPEPRRLSHREQLVRRPAIPRDSQR